MKVQDGITDAVAGEPSEDALDDNLIANRKCRLGAQEGQGTEAGSQTRGQHERWIHAPTLLGMILRLSKGHSELKTMFVPVSPNSSRCLMNSVRYESSRKSDGVRPNAVAIAWIPSS